MASITLLSIAVLNCAAPPPREVSISPQQTGIFESKRPAPGAAYPSILATHRRKFVLETREIPAVLDTSFGLTFRILTEPRRSDVELTVIWRSPPVTNPETEVTSTEIGLSQIRLPTNRVLPAIYRFDHPWELVTGTWTLEIFHLEKLIFESEFEVVSP